MKTVQAAMDTCLSGKSSVMDNLSYEIAMEDGTTAEKVWRISQDPVRNAEGDVTHILQRASDITDHVIKERQNAAVAREINHRAKNTMAVVTAIARITSRNSVDYESFLSSFTGRIDAMRRTHDRREKGLGRACFACCHMLRLSRPMARRASARQSI